MPINYILIFGQSVGYILMSVRIAVRGSARAGAIWRCRFCSYDIRLSC